MALRSSVFLCVFLWPAFALCMAGSFGAVSPYSQDNLAPQATLQQIAGLLERGDFGAASGLVEPALTAHPADPVLHNLAGVIAASALAM